ncbi:MAG: hydroxymethylbilane synthase [Thermodesulfobacteriota bacterium]
MKPAIRIGTRGSQLALWQARWVGSAIQGINPDVLIEIVMIKTKGDKILDTPLAKVGGKGLFVKEIEEALIGRRIDLAVHSLKDMPADIPFGLCIGPVPKRENPNDVLISKSGLPLAQLPEGARIGTSSLRRAAQLLHQRPDIAILPLRGNLDTRLRKLETEALDAIVLAAAGLKRLALENRITEYLEDAVMLPAVGQGALCLELRKDDARTAAAVAGLNHPETRTVVMGERAFLNRLEGGCQVPIAARGKIKNDHFSIEGLVANLDGTVMVRDTLSGPSSESEKTGIALAERLLSLGAKVILDKLKTNEPDNTQR